MTHKSIKFALLAVSALGAGGVVFAGGLPQGGVVQQGAAGIRYTGDTLNIDQQSDKAVIDWNSFSVGKGNTVNFNQPASDSATLNRVTGDFTSEIAGQINANGSVFLVNPNGILITADGVIDTGNFVASTLDIDNNDFLNGDYTFANSGQNGVVDNRGSIAVDDGGFVALLGGAVKNSGVVRAHVGKVGFAGGEKIVMSFGNNDFLRVEVPTDKWDNLSDSQGNKVSATVDLGGTIESRGGFIDITVADASDILRQSIFMSGVVAANTVSSTDGVISISGGTLGINGRITADADYGNAGSINIAVDSIDGNGQFSAAAQNGTGGTIKVSLQHGADLTVGTRFDVSGRTVGGSLSFIGGLSGKGGSKILGSIDFKADSTDGKGGYIDISNKGGLVGLFSGTLSATGKAQGGRIRLGGAFQGGGYDPKTSQLDTKTQDLFVTRWADNSSLVSADKTSLGTGVHIDVSSASGKGGTAILWADHTTNNYAAIDATGASGGAVEISGKKKVESFGLARVKAGNGIILLDPENVVIIATKTTVSLVKKIAFSGSKGDRFGESVALSRNGKVLVVGSPNDDTGASGAGAVYVYTISKGNWGAISFANKIKHGTATGFGTSLTLKANDHFGYSVSLNTDGSKLAVGATGDDTGGSNRGAVYLFKIDPYNQQDKKKVAQRAKLAHNSGKVGFVGGVYLYDDDLFGTSVSLSGDGSRLAVGLTGMTPSGVIDGGAVYVLWIKSWDDVEHKLGMKKIDVHRLKVGRILLNSTDKFGGSVSLNGDGTKLAIGAYGDSTSRGTVYLFTVEYSRATGEPKNPTLVTKFTHSSSQAYDEFGRAVTLSSDGSKLGVGAPHHNNSANGDPNYGTVYLYNIGQDVWNNKWNKWYYSSNLTPTFDTKIDFKYADSKNTNPDKWNNKYDFGTSLSFSYDGFELIIGAPYEDSGSSDNWMNTGGLYVFNISGYTTAGDIKGQLNKGTDVQIVASNDITVNADITATSGSGKLTLIAGRSILVNQDIDIGGSLVLKANAAMLTGVRDTVSGDYLDLHDRKKGAAVVTVANNKKLEAGGDLIIEILANTAHAYMGGKNAIGAITVGEVKGERVSIVYEDDAYVPAGTIREIIVRSGGQVEATKAPSASEVVLELKADKFTNQSGSSALKTASSNAQYLVWTKTPKDNTMGGINNYDFVEFNKSHGGSDFKSRISWHSSVTGTGDGFIYSVNPGQLLKLTVRVKTKIYDGTSDMVAVSGGNLKFKDSNAVSGLTFAIGNAPSGGHKKFFATSASFGTKLGDDQFYKNGVVHKDAGTGLVLKYAAPTDLIYKDGNGKTVHGISTVAYEEATGASITQRTLKVGATYQNRDYDGTNNVINQAIVTIGNWALNEGDGKGISDVFNGTFTATAASKDVGVRAVTLGGLTGLKTAYATNYKFDFTKNGADYDNNKFITINKRTLKVGTTYSNRDYDGTRNVTINQATVTIDGWVAGEGDSNINRVFNGVLTATAASRNAGTHIVTLGGLTGLKSAYTTNYKFSYDNSKYITIDPRPLNLEIDDTSAFRVRDRAYDAGKVSAPVSIYGGKKGFDARDLIAGDSGVILEVREGAFVYSDDKQENNKPIFIGNTNKFILSSPNYRLQYKSRDLVQGTITGRTGNITKTTGFGGHRRLANTPTGGGGGGVDTGAVAVVGSGMLAIAAGVVGVAGGAASGIIDIPFVRTQTIFDSGVYAHLNGIDMQALYQPPAQTLVPFVFNTQQATYKAKYTTTYDIKMLAKNIKTQKVVPLYELDEKLYETLRRIFVQQLPATDKTAGIHTQKLQKALSS